MEKVKCETEGAIEDDVEMCSHCGERPRASTPMCDYCRSAYLRGYRSKKQTARDRAPMLRYTINSVKDTAPILIDLMVKASDRKRRENLSEQLDKHFDDLLDVANEAVEYLGE